MRVSARRAIILTITLISLSWRLSAQGILIPNETFVGDSADFTFETGAFASSLENGAVYSVPSENILPSDDVTVVSVLVVPNGASASVTIRFIPWVSGSVSLPTFALQGVRVAPPQARIASIVEKTGRSSIQGARSPLLVPGTTWLLYGLTALALAAAVGFFWAGFWFRRIIRQAPGKRLAGRRVSLFSRELRRLERRPFWPDRARWLSAFSLSARRYFGALCVGDLDGFLSLTGAEIGDRVSALPGCARLSSSVVSLFAASDRARFGGAEENDWPDFIALARELSESLESAHDAALSELAREGEVSAHARV